ncbi:MAG: hypothetical protein MK110_07765 [Fuerstiella sp.]|nr:hypothetical protein [Fuerstiella sp.]
MSFTSLFILSCVLRVIIRIRSSLTGLTARSAAGWAAVACGLVMVSTVMKLLPAVPPAVTSAIHSLASAFLLAPLIDILGARNPGHRAWPWFVVIPMILVLQWPAASQLFSQSPRTPIAVPLPTAGCFILLLTMGAGNHFGTANTTACFTGVIGILLFGVPVTEWSPWPGNGYCLASSICLAVTALLVEGRLSTVGRNTSHEQLWIDFRDIYGLVWAHRVMDRINQFSGREQWNVVMTLEGFQLRNGNTKDGDGLDRPNEVLRWVLRRFADTEFLDRYLPDEDITINQGAS